MLPTFKLPALLAALLLAGACAPLAPPPSAPDAPLAAPPAAAATGQHYRAVITAVSDGDTVRVRTAGGQTRRIRLAFIDAPETTQPHGMESRAALAALVDGREAEVEIIDTDRYRREVARLRVDGRDVNFTQVQNGHAWHYRSIAKHNQRKDDYAHYATAEQYAREQRIGLWRQPDPTAPWDHRRTRRKADKPQ
ncbi:thermonuclease family protein [Conchiformibius kuhniae]|uniref:Thermonuclease family protein n=1 Tax=Conchiformibius kuhniae TaxID=211502 RepID=A0A8T9MWZ4_9NEIS|nr:thermonuclease family protein [Conchiformibius kuhniae]